MAEIGLRAYVKEIDDLVEHEQLDEAIAHSRHILETYPKHLDTYRLLGKAYLEAKRYGDAADLFQRVLSAIPDDFVGHIGMSIVREDEANLDASIWHMERAFETNPANPAIQQELRRLIGKRDGLEPHKVRLTRGALARMYAHGELYPQAIAELRSALQEDPERPDLQVLLAGLHWRTDQKDQAAEVALQILEKLPFCREANRIVAGSLQATGKAEEAAPFHRRLAALDPYAAFVETAMTDPGTVDPGSVHLQKLEWRPGHPVAAPEPSRRSWTDSLGAGLRAEPKPVPPAGPLPSWLSEEPSKAAPEPAQAGLPAPASPDDEPTAAVHPFASANPPAADIPPWMREAGWAESTGEAAEGPVSFSDEELAGAVPPAAEGELAPADIPDWLKDIAPAPTDEQRDVDGEGGGPDWLAGVAAESQAQPSGPPAAPPAKPAKAGDQSEVPTWLEEASPGATETIVTWLGDRSARAAAPPPPEPPSEAPLPESEQPSWLTEPASVESEAPAEAESTSEEPPSWLSGVAEAAASDRPAMAEPPSWVTEDASEESIEQDLVERPPATAEAPDWLRAIAGPGEGETAEEPAESDWLAGLTSAASSPARPAEPSGPEWLRGIGEPDEKSAEPVSGQEAPEWLRGLGAGPGPVRAEEQPASAEPGWLAGLTSGAPPAAAGAGAGIDWLRGIGEPELGPPEGVETPSSSPAEIQPEFEAPAGAVSDDDWLRGLAGLGSTETDAQPEAQVSGGEPWEGSDELSESAASAGETPDWLGRLAAAQDVPPPGAAGQPAWSREAAPEPPEEQGEEPSWLAGMPEAAMPSGPAIPEPVADDWLKGLLDDAGLPEEPGLAAAGSEEPDWFAAQPAGQETPEVGPDIRATATGWLRDAAELPPAADAEASTETPDWLREFEAAGGPLPSPGAPTLIARREAEGAQPPPPGTPVEAMDASTAGELGEDDVQKWLEALASRQESSPRAEIEGIPAAPSQAFPPRPATRQPPPDEPEEGMEWLEQMAAQVAPAESDRSAAPAWKPMDDAPEAAEPAEPAADAGTDEEEVPDWLRSLAAEGEVAEPAESEAEASGTEWLLAAASTTIAARTPGAPSSAPVPGPEGEPLDEQAPDWLRIPAAGEPPSEAEPLAPPAGAPEETPDWLHATPGSTAPQAEAEAEAEGDDTPGWLRRAADSEAQTARLYEEDETGGVPEWLQQAADAEPSTAPGVPKDMRPAPAPEPPAGLEPEKPAPPEPSWLRPSEPAVPKPQAAEDEIVVPEWLRPPVGSPEPPVSPQAERPIPAEAPAAKAPAAEAPQAEAPAAKAPAAEAPQAEAPAAKAPAAKAPAAEVPEPEIPQPAEPVVAQVGQAAAAPPEAAAPPPASPPPTAVGPPEGLAPTPAPPTKAEEPAAAPASLPEPVAPTPPKARTTARTPAETLAAARQALASNDIRMAAKHYGTLVRRRSLVEDVIVDLKVAVERLPESAELWQTLGDAYMKADSPAEAVEAYRHGLANL